MPIDKHMSGSNIIKPANQVNYRCFSSTCWSNQCNTFSRAHFEVHTLEDWMPRLIFKHNILKLHFPFNRWKFIGVFCVFNFDRFVHGFKNTFQIGKSVNHFVIDIRNVQNRLPETGSIVSHGNQGTKFNDWLNPEYSRHINKSRDNLGNIIHRKPDPVRADNTL